MVYMLTAKEVAYEVTKALDSKKGMDIKLLKIGEVSSLADYFIICTGTPIPMSRPFVTMRSTPSSSWASPCWAVRVTGATPGSFWTLALSLSMCLPRMHGHFTIWNAFGQMLKKPYLKTNPSPNGRKQKEG